MHPELFRLGPLVVRYYGLMYVVALLLGVILLRLEAKRRGLPPERVVDAAFCAFVSGFVGDHRQESHPGCWEEIIWLAGDFFMPGTGRQAAGSYVGNPSFHRHGPLLTQRGCILLVHTDAPADFCFHEPPVPESLLSAYMDGVSWLEQPEHVAIPAAPPWGS